MESFELTIPQQNIWNLHRFYEETPVANQCGAVIFDVPRDGELLRRAVLETGKQYSALRIRLSDTEPVSQYFAPWEDPDIPELFFDSEEELDRFGEKTAAEPVTAFDRPLFRFFVFHVSGKKSGALAVFSHLIADAWSFAQFVGETDRIFRELEKNPLYESEERYDYRDYIASDRKYRTSGRFEKDAAFWEAKYEKAPGKSLIKTHTRETGNIEARRVCSRIPEDLGEKMDRFCSVTDTSYAVLFEGAVMHILSRINPSENDMTIGMLVLNRASLMEKKTMGMYISTMPLTVDVRSSQTVLDLVLAVQDQHRRDFRHQKYPFSEIMKKVRKTAGEGTSLYDVMVSFQNAVTGSGAETRWYFSGCSEVPVVIHIDNRDGLKTARVTLDYQTAVFPDGREAELFLKRLFHVLSQMVSDPGKRLSDLEILPEEEKRMLLHGFNDTAADLCIGRGCLQEIIKKKAAECPGRDALVYREKRITYGELDRMSDSFAGCLMEKGISGNAIVPVIAGRSWRVVIAMLGIMKAGAAFVYIDKNYPDKRIDSILEDVGEGPVCLLEYDRAPGGRKILDLSDDDFFARKGTEARPGDPDAWSIRQAPRGSPRGSASGTGISSISVFMIKEMLQEGS